MAVTITCAGCSQRLRIARERFGDIGRCPTCRGTFKVVAAPDGTIAVMALVDAEAVRERPSTRPVAKAVVTAGQRPRVTSAGEVREPPFFVEDGAVVECPWCARRLRTECELFNEDLVCPGCSRDFKVLVHPRRRIPIRCPSCLLRMEVSEKMAGRQTACVGEGCGYSPVQVPTSPIRVRRIESDDPLPPPIPALTADVATGVLLGTVLRSRRSGSRLCPGCHARYVRNPSGYCHKCRR